MKWLIVSRSAFLPFFLATWATAYSSSANGENPVSKVVSLLEDLKSKIEADQDMNQKAHDKYQCWCGEVEESKTKSVSEAKALAKSISEDIDIKSAEKKSLDEKLEKTANDMKDAQAEYNKASELYNKLATSLKHQIAESSEAVESIVKAKAFLGGPVALIQQHSSAMKAALKDVILALPTIGKVKLNATSLGLLEKAVTVGPVSMTSALTGIMEELDNSFNSSLGELMDQKKQADASHENATADVKARLDLLNKETKQMRSKVADTESEIAEQAELKGATEAQKKADAAFLKSTSKNCAQRRTEFNNFLKQRQEELEGCNNALEHLTSDSARELTLRSVKSGASFLELSGKGSLVSERALKQLQAEAVRIGSRRLSELAAQVRKALPNGGFKAVLSSMDTMLKALTDEAASDQAKKDKCQENYQTIASTVNKQAFLVQKNSAKIAVQENKIEDFQNKQAQAEEDTDENDKELASLKKMRESEAATYAAEKKDDENSVKLLKETLAMLAKFYSAKKSKENAGLLQEPVIPEGTSQENKDLKRSEAKYTLSDKNELKGAASMILGMMEHIISGLESDIASSTAEEKKAIADYNAQKAELETSNKELQSTITDLKGDISKANAKISDRDDDKAAAQQEVGAQNAFKSKIEEECDWIISKFTERFEKRESEAAGIKRAKDLLANTGLSFLQRHSSRHTSLRGVMQAQ